MKENVKSLKPGSLERKHEVFICISPEVNADALGWDRDKCKQLTKNNIEDYEASFKKQGFESYHKGKGGWLDLTGEDSVVKREPSYIVSSIKRDGVSYPEELEELCGELMTRGHQNCYSLAVKQGDESYIGWLVYGNGKRDEIGVLSRISDLEGEALKGWAQMGGKNFSFQAKRVIAYMHGYYRKRG